MRMLTAYLSRLVRRLARDERGITTIQNLLLTVACCAIGALGLDVTHFYAARTELQVAADVAAHAAMHRRYNGRTAAQARSDAIAMVEYSLPRNVYGTVLETSEIVFGTWNTTSGTFTALAANSPTLPTAFQVTTNRAGDNPVGSFFFRVVGVRSRDVTAKAIYLASGDPCAQLQGLFAEGQVNPSSNNAYSANFCLHSNDEVPLNADNRFDPLSSVSAPSLSDIDCASNDANMDAKCPNLRTIRREATYDLERHLAPIRDLPGADTDASMLADVREAVPNWNWTGISQSISTVTAAQLGTPSNLSGRVNYIECASNGKIELSGAYTDTVLLLNNCQVSIKKNNTVSLSNTIIYTTSTDKANSIAFSGSGHRIGMDPTCTGSGGAVLLTRGGFNTASGTKFQNATVWALGDVGFAAGAGAQDAAGVSIIAGGEIKVTSNNVLNACPPDPNAPPTMVSFRLAG